MKKKRGQISSSDESEDIDMGLGNLNEDDPDAYNQN